jgi:hypothetical protein
MLETVDVNVQCSHGPARAAGPSEHLLGAVDDQHSVRQACQGVVQRLVAEPPLRPQEILLCQELPERDERCEQHGNNHEAEVAMVDDQQSETGGNRNVGRPARPTSPRLVGEDTLWVGSSLGRSRYGEQRHRDQPQ